MKTGLTAMVVAFIAGCGGGHSASSPSGDLQIDTSVDALSTFTPVDAIVIGLDACPAARAGPAPKLDASFTEMSIQIRNVGSTCAAVQANATLANATTIEISIGSADGAFAPGSYAVGLAGPVILEVVKTSASCGVDIAQDLAALNGTLTIDTASETAITGTFSVTQLGITGTRLPPSPIDGTLSGRFNAQFCRFDSLAACGKASLCQ